jgi:hypothetical protein
MQGAPTAPEWGERSEGFLRLLLHIWPTCRFRQGDREDDFNSADWWMVVPGGDREVPIGARVVRYNDEFNHDFTIRDGRNNRSHPSEWERLLEADGPKPKRYRPGFLVYAISNPDGVGYHEAYIVNLEALKAWFLIGKVVSHRVPNKGAAEGKDSYFRVFSVYQWPENNPVVHKWSDKVKEEVGAA